ncbi:MAG: hypothetical protein GY938_13160 [Ketobacter sp.]|nr:hypothetical protein [Ketobacter sp.]
MTSTNPVALSTKAIERTLEGTEHPYTIPAGVKLNDFEWLVLISLLESAASNGYDFGFTDWNEANAEATAAMQKGQKSYRSYVGKLVKKELIYAYGTESDGDGNYSQCDIRMEPSIVEEVAEGIKATLVIDERYLADEKEHAERMAASDLDQITVKDLMDFKLFYSRRKLVYLITPHGFDQGYLRVKGNKADFYSKLESMKSTEIIEAQVTEDEIIIG